MRDGRELGQYFTPRAVVGFALEALETFGARLRGARLIDPACGPGEWLKAALDAGAAEVTGMDCDLLMQDAWRETGLAGHPDCLLKIADSLRPDALEAGGFDCVVGNPPFGTRLDPRDADGLVEIASNYGVPDLAQRRSSDAPRTGRDLDRLARFPTELLFLERFIQLARDDGWIAIVLPEGIAANKRWRAVRAWLLGTVTVHAVIGLPRDTFRAHSTAARTCLLLMHNRPAAPDHRVALASVEDCAPATLERLHGALKSGSVLSADAPSGLLPPPLFRS